VLFRSFQLALETWRQFETGQILYYSDWHGSRYWKLSSRLSDTVIKIWPLKDNGVMTLIFWGHVTSSVTWPFDSRWSTFYGRSIVTMRLS